MSMPHTGWFAVGDTHQRATKCMPSPVADAGGDGEVGGGPAGDEFAVSDRGGRPRRHLAHPELVACRHAGIGHDIGS